MIGASLRKWPREWMRCRWCWGLNQLLPGISPHCADRNKIRPRDLNASDLTRNIRPSPIETRRLERRIDTFCERISSLAPLRPSTTALLLPSHGPPEDSVAVSVRLLSFQRERQRWRQRQLGGQREHDERQWRRGELPAAEQPRVGPASWRSQLPGEPAAAQPGELPVCGGAAPFSTRSTQAPRGRWAGISRAAASASSHVQSHWIYPLGAVSGALADLETCNWKPPCVFYWLLAVVAD